jgi:Ras GTPase-activating-like protein IQGAP2/3
MDGVTRNELLYMETKSIFVQLIQSIPNAGDTRPINLPSIVERAATSEDATLVRKGIKVKDMLRELEELRVVEQTDGYKLMQDEIAAELAHLDNLREEVQQESKNEAVKADVLGSYRFTHAQLEKEGIIVESNIPENK